MVYIENPLVLPLVILIWSADTWLWLASIRFVLRKTISTDNSFYIAIKSLTDPLPGYLKQLSKTYLHKSLPDWVPWVTGFTVLMVLRHMLLQLIISFQCK